jgi:hypothetical protein
MEKSVNNKSAKIIKQQQSALQPPHCLLPVPNAFRNVRKKYIALKTAHKVELLKHLIGCRVCVAAAIGISRFPEAGV